MSLRTAIVGHAKRLLTHYLAPQGTWRGRLKQSVVDLLRDPKIRESREPLPIYDRAALFEQLPYGGRAFFDGNPKEADTDVAGAARFVLGLIRDREDLRVRYSNALSGPSRAAFCQWICSNESGFALSPAACAHVCEAFARQAGTRVRVLYAQLPSLRRMFPLGMLPGGRRRFLHWLLQEGTHYGISAEDAWWFIYEAAAHPGAMLAESYLIQPEWQRAVPDGLTAEGQARLRAWLKRRYRVESSWLDETVIPDRQKPGHERLGVNILGHFVYPSGLQEQALAAVRAAEAAGIAVSARDVPAGPGKDSLDRTEFMGMEDHPVSVFYFGSEPPVPVCYDLAGLAARNGVHRVVAWSWELETAPRSFARNARAAHEFWAHTRFIAGAMAKVLPIPVYHMLPGVELKPFEPLPRARFGLPEDRCVFLFVFDMNSVMERKNPLGLIRAYQKAFRPDDRAALVIKVSRGNADPANLKRLQDAAREAGAILIDEVMSRSECTAIMNCCDCYVSLHRSEGFGFTMAEAMLLGKPVIATAYSGNLDFMTEENSLLVGCERVPLPTRIGVYPRGAVWADPHIDEAARHMRWVYEHPAEARELGDKGRRYAGELLSFRAAGLRMKARLELIAANRRA